jgi:hypothetical protein
LLSGGKTLFCLAYYKENKIWVGVAAPHDLYTASAHGLYYYTEILQHRNINQHMCAPSYIIIFLRESTFHF